MGYRDPQGSGVAAFQGWGEGRDLGVQAHVLFGF